MELMVLPSMSEKSAATGEVFGSCGNTPLEDNDRVPFLQ